MSLVDPDTGEVVDLLPVPASPADLAVGWFETQAAPFFAHAEPDAVVSSWERMVALDELLVRAEQQSAELRRAVRWAERRIGIDLGDSKDGPRPEIPQALRVLDHTQKSAFRKMARVDADTFLTHITSTDDTKKLSRARVAKWAQHRINDAAEEAARAAVIEDTLADASGDGWRMFHGDFRERLLELEPGSVDMILTDPPYPAEFLPLWADLAQVAAKILKPQGLLVAMSGKIHLDQVMAALGAHLAYGWVYCQPLPGSHTRVMARHTLQAWKPWLAYSNGQWPAGRIDWHPDVLDPSARSKDRYRWEQDPDPAISLVHELTDPGALIVDPFAGSASFGVAALELDRKFIGVELDAERFTECVSRLEGK